MRDYCNRLQVLGLAVVFAMTAAVALALPAAADPPAAAHPVAPAPAAPSPAKPACTAEQILSSTTSNCTLPATAATDTSKPCTDPICAMGRISDMMGAIHTFASNPIAAIGSWMATTITGGSSGFAGQLLMGTPDFTTGVKDPTTGVLKGNAFSYLNQWFLGVAGVVFGIALLLRVIKQSIDEGGRGAGSAINVLVDIGPRLLIFPAMALVSFPVITGLAKVSADIGGQVFVEFASIAGAELAGAGMFAAFSKVMATALSPSGFVLMGISGLALACMLIYVVMLSAMRFVLLSFMVVIAPVAIMCGAYDTKNQVFQWWLTSTIGALLVPVIVGAVAGLTVIMSMVPTMTGTQGGAMAGAVFMIGGLWFMGKALHHATLGAFQGKHFSGMLAAAEVGMFAWTRPLNWHRSMASAVPGVAAAKGGGGGGGGKTLQSAAGAIGVTGGGGSGGDTAAEAAAVLAPRTGFRRAVETAVANGPLKDDVGAVAAAGGMSDAPLNEQVDYYLAQPYNAEKVYLGMHQEHMTAPGGFINPADPKNTTEAINANFAAVHPELYSGGPSAAGHVAGYIQGVRDFGPSKAAVQHPELYARPSAAPMVGRPRSPEHILLIPNAGDDI